MGTEHIAVYSVKECSCCREVEGLGSGSVMLVNLMLVLPCKRQLGFAARLPEQPLACTMELQVGTADAFKRMKKGLDLHDRTSLQSRFPLVAKAIALAGGSEGKLSLPLPKGKSTPTNTRTADAQQGKHLLDMSSAIDVMHPEPQHRDAQALVATAPTADGLQILERNRTPPGSRWTTVWQSQGRIVRIDGISLRVGGKLPPACKFALLLSGLCKDGSVDHLAEEQLSKVPVSRGELHFISDGQSPRGNVLGNISQYSKVMLEYFEPQRSAQWVDLSDLHIKVVQQAPEPDTGDALEDSAMELDAGDDSASAQAGPCDGTDD